MHINSAGQNPQCELSHQPIHPNLRPDESDQSPLFGLVGDHCPAQNWEVSRKEAGKVGSQRSGGETEGYPATSETGDDPLFISSSSQNMEIEGGGAGGERELSSAGVILARQRPEKNRVRGWT